MPTYRDRAPRGEVVDTNRGTLATRAEPPEDPDDVHGEAARAMAKATVEQMSADARERRPFEEKRSLVEILVELARGIFGR